MPDGQSGQPQPQPITSQSTPQARRRAGRANRDPEVLLSEARQGNRLALARLISAVERGGAESREIAGLAYRESKEVPTVGVTGAPGAGKSTLVSRLIAKIRTGSPETGQETVGVLAIDPTSPFSGGAILGDRVRMQDHALDEGVFIRSMATRGHLGGLTIAVPEAVRLLAAVGLDRVVIETVGVGQVEVEVASAADTTLVVVNPGWGDSVQANKAGLLEIADVFIINKADRPGARQTRLDLEQMLDLSQTTDWRPPIVETTATNNEGLDELFEEIKKHEAHLAGSGVLESRRARRLERELDRVITAEIAREVDQISDQGGYDEVLKAVVAREIDPYEAADRLIRAALERFRGATEGGSEGATEGDSEPGRQRES